jgi:hypothetical protein
MKKFLYVIIYSLLLCANVLAVTELKHTVKASGGDYASLAGAMTHLAASHANLVTADVYASIEIDGTWAANDTSAVTISGITTDATHYINIYTTAAARHKGVFPSATYYRLVVTGSTTINNSVDNVFLDGIPFKTIATNQAYAYGFKNEFTFTNLRVSNCIIVGELSGTTGSGGAWGIFYYSTGVGYAWNNIVYGWLNGTNACVGIYTNGASKIYSNTVVDSYIAYTTGWAGAVFKNNIAQGATTGYTSGNATGIKNLSNAADAPGTSPQNSKTVTFKDAGNKDYHLGASDTVALNIGSDSSGDSAPMNFTTDIDGDTRSGTWDIGADEIVAASGPAMPVLQYYYNQLSKLIFNFFTTYRSLLA